MTGLTWKRALAVGALAMVAGCAAKPPPPPPPPPPPVVIVVPPRPMPPDHAPPNLTVPQLDVTGLRYSVNRNITPAQTVWNLRSAYNVAALNCLDPKFGEILVNYRAFLKAHDKRLSAINKKVDAEFKAQYGKGFVVPREKYMTEVYNHFALPPTLKAFCTAVLAVGRDGRAVKSADLELFAARSLPNIEVVFDDFYRRYDAYRWALADWNAKYGPPPTAVNPGPIIVPPMTVPGAAPAGAGKPAAAAGR